MGLKKPKRIVSHALIEYYKSQGCAVCGWKPCDAHHLKSRGAGGDDVPENLISLCRRHHCEAHRIGRRKFLDKYGLSKCYNKFST